MADPSRPVTGYPAAAPNGYPYPGAAAHPPPHQLPQSYGYPYAYNQAGAASRAVFLRRVIAVMAGFFIVTASVVFVVWMVLRPRVPEFVVDSASVANLNISSPSSISGDWSFGLSVVNPNKKMSISYDDLNAELLYHGNFLTGSRLPPFSQATRNRSAVNASFSAKDSYVGDNVVSGISADKGKGAVPFTLRVWARAGFRSGGWRLRRRLLRVLCENIAVGVPSGSLVSGTRECRVSV